MMFSPMTSSQRKASCVAAVAFLAAFVGLTSGFIPNAINLAAFTIGTVFWCKAMFLK